MGCHCSCSHCGDEYPTPFTIRQVWLRTLALVREMNARLDVLERVVADRNREI